MSYNRLSLNWELNLRTERTAFVEEYLAAIPFRPTEDELETISNYILWGKRSESEKDGPARLREDGFYLDSKWTSSTSEIESLDELAESPSFSENDLRPLDAPAPKRVREVFSREKARKYASPVVLENLEAIWTQIDVTELTLNFYELAHGKRKNPPREELLNRLSTEEIDAARARSSRLNQFTYFKLKHQLKDLREQQYSFEDTYVHTLLPLKMKPYQEHDSSSEFGADIEILPMGTPHQGTHEKTYAKIFNPERTPAPADFDAKELDFISSILWKPAQSKKIFDFGDTDHLYEFFNMWDDLRDRAEESESIRLLLRTANTYISLADLDEKELVILKRKIQGKSNQEIRDEICEKFGHKYQLNYISTLYCKKILEKIAAAASIHREVCENLFFPENFKKCKDCGRWILLDERNWMKRKRSNDGFSPRCKKCEKIKRLG